MAESTGAISGVTYVTKTPGWIGKMLLGGLLASIPFVEALADGYQIETIKRIKAHDPHPLPDWDKVGDFVAQGVKLRIVIYLMYIPSFFVSFIATLLSLLYLCGIGITVLHIAPPERGEHLTMAANLATWILIPLLDLFAAAFMFILFLTVPALARRVADGDSFISLFNPFPALRLITLNLWMYILARLTVVVLVFLAAIISGPIAFIPCFGVFLGWLCFGLGRFWGRMTWANYLGHMKR